LFFNFFVPKTYFLKVLDGALFLWTLWVLLLGLSNQKMTLTTLNTNFQKIWKGLQVIEHVLFK